VIKWISDKELEDFVGAKFYCPRAVAHGNQHIRIKEKMLECSSVFSSPTKYTVVNCSTSSLTTLKVDMPVGD